ncbi:Mg2+ and Co2+ transporter CorA [Raineyella antarctica]|uniref:Mg2+ and Co2+ transporter CorA n=2 Tax=Raineyella antarctica TaxID=1577474 RepID=A0A1G6HMF2_9ACTN|nr:Mg2+ and Co2+ transporter CorA [Raineyella antarctica]
MEAVAALREDSSGWLWLDFPEPDAATGAWLRDVFRLPLTAIQDVLQRNHVSRLYAFGDSLLFLVLHRPEPGEQGHVHYLELDQFIAPDFLITTHGPHSEQVPVGQMLVETDVVAERLLAGKVGVTGPAQIAHTIVSRLCQEEERFVNSVAHDVGLLEQKVMAQTQIRAGDGFLDELFRVRHSLLTVHTMAAQGAEVFGRATRLYEQASWLQPTLRDLQDQYERVGRISDSQLQFLAGVTEYYRASTDQKMAVAGEKLAVIAAVTLPVSAVSGVMGMQTIQINAVDWPWTIVMLAVMTVMSLWLLRWTKRQGWW